MTPKKRQIGLAVGGGGARGWAHIGVINTMKCYRAADAIRAGYAAAREALAGGVFVKGGA